MRPPRYHFPDEVRTATRSMAARMVEQGTVATSPTELDAWIAANEDLRAPLVHGGYGTEFASEDLLPLLEVFVAKASPPVAVATPTRTTARWVVGGIVLLVLIVGGMFLASRVILG